MLPPPLTDPDVRLSRIRLFIRLITTCILSVHKCFHHHVRCSPFCVSVYMDDFCDDYHCYHAPRKTHFRCCGLQLSGWVFSTHYVERPSGRTVSPPGITANTIPVKYLFTYSYVNILTEGKINVYMAKNLCYTYFNFTASQVPFFYSFCCILWNSPQKSLLETQTT